MRRTKVLGVALAALCALGGIAAGQASAAIEFAWHVNGSELGAGQEKTLTSKAKNTQVLKGTAFGVKVEIQCKEVSTSGAKIIGGLPGTSSETVEYTGCTVVKPSQCKVQGGTITTNPLKDEIVEGVGTSEGKAFILFTPKTGNVFAEPKLEGFLCPSIPVNGSVLAEPTEQKVEVETGVLKFEAAGKEYKNHAGETKKAGLTLAGSSSTVTGEVETKLSPVEKFGIF